MAGDAVAGVEALPCLLSSMQREREKKDGLHDCWVTGDGSAASEASS